MPSIIEKVEGLDKYEDVVKKDPDRALVFTLAGIDDMSRTVQAQGKVLEEHCKAPAHLAHPDTPNPIEVAKEEGKIKTSLAEHWGKVLVSVAGMVISFLAGLYMV